MAKTLNLQILEVCFQVLIGNWKNVNIPSVSSKTLLLKWQENVIKLDTSNLTKTVPLWQKSVCFVEKLNTNFCRAVPVYSVYFLLNVYLRKMNSFLRNCHAVGLVNSVQHFILLFQALIFMALFLKLFRKLSILHVLSEKLFNKSPWILRKSHFVYNKQASWKVFLYDFYARVLLKISIPIFVKANFDHYFADGFRFILWAIKEKVFFWLSTPIICLLNASLREFLILA